MSVTDSDVDSVQTPEIVDPEIVDPEVVGPEVVDTESVATREPLFVDRIQGIRLFLAFLLLATVFHLPGLFHQVFNSDEAYLATQAQVLSHGGKLYTDTVDRKPPIVPYLYLGAFKITGSDNLLSVHVLAILAHALTATLLAAEARRRYGARGALIAGVLYLCACATLYPSDTQAANFEVFMLPLMTAAIVLGNRQRFLSGGVVASLATLTKQTASTTLLPLAWLAWRWRKWRGLALLAIGLALPIALSAFIFGAKDFLFWVFTSNGGYLDVGGAFSYVLREGFANTLMFLVANAALFMLLPAAWRRRRENLDLWLWAASAAIGVSIGFRFFGHYYLQLLPPLSLLATGPLVRASRRLVTVAATLVALPLVWFGGAAVATAMVSTPASYHAISAYIDAHTKSADRIFVWGHYPEVYWSSDRIPASRFVTTGFLTGHSGGRPADQVGQDLAVPGAWKDFLDDMQVHPPALILDTSPANIRNAALYPPEAFPQFASYLYQNYDKVATVDYIDVYARKRTH
ncbi:MAG TPA: glycosyltransferase family 39 protein [Acidimicrobiia bacterium]|nr:glycosyltransferase family 39 protein [Acidimicrobiia bacterium]